MTATVNGSPEREPTLGEFWNLFYDREILQRFNMLEEWRWVQEAGTSPLGDALRARYMCSGRYDPPLLSAILRHAACDGEHPIQERSLLIADILMMLRDTDASDSSLFSSLVEFFLEGRRPSVSRPHPEKFLVELTNNCNLNCVMCGVGAKGYDPSRTMELSFFESICRNTLRTAKTVRLNGLGETTIVPDFHRYLDLAEELAASLELVTNLSTRDRHLLARLIDMDFMLFISCDAVRRDDLSRIRRGLDVEQFLENIRYIHELSSGTGRDRLKTQIIMTILNCNFRQLPEMVEFAARNGIGGVIANMQKGGSGNWMRNRFSELVETFRKAERVAQQTGVLLMLPDRIEGLPVPLGTVSFSNHSSCPTYREEAFIRYNGDVCPCNMMNPYVYGNLRRNSMREVLCSLPSILFDYLMEGGSRHPYCLNCYYLRRKADG
ncbi:MAG: radical SAM protein [Thermoplasmata archaeon YP2-bin.285]|uniref:Radical SAM protein n=1 Tax=Candidatus Sysuiplasma superficiale TaxID=2823368 RepID=A0A8J8CCT9_9ARCH|nr:radical SAM protein [Candidatus Sysuiplasma superficiale]